jgi:hypothetical protein
MNEKVEFENTNGLQTRYDACRSIAEIGGPAKHGNTPTRPVFYPQRFSRSCSTLVNVIDSVGYSAAAISQLGSYRKCQRPLPIAQHLIDHGSRV